MHNRIYANIHMDALEQNLSSMKANLKEGTQMIGVIKADAYGHGAVPVAQYMEPKDYVSGLCHSNRRGGRRASPGRYYETDPDPWFYISRAL